MRKRNAPEAECVWLWGHLGISDEVFGKKSLYYDRRGSDRNIIVVNICEMVGGTFCGDGGIKIALDGDIDDTDRTWEKFG